MNFEGIQENKRESRVTRAIEMAKKLGKRGLNIVSLALLLSLPLASVAKGSDIWEDTHVSGTVSGDAVVGGVREDGKDIGRSRKIRNNLSLDEAVRENNFVPKESFSETHSKDHSPVRKGNPREEGLDEALKNGDAEIVGIGSKK